MNEVSVFRSACASLFSVLRFNADSPALNPEEADRGAIRPCRQLDSDAFMHESLVHSFPHGLDSNNTTSSDHHRLPLHTSHHRHSTSAEPATDNHPSDSETLELQEVPLLASNEHVDEADDPSHSSSSQMPSRTRSATRQPSDRPGSSSSSVTGSNGQVNGMMKSDVAYRGKNASLDNLTENLIAHDSFNLDHEPPNIPIMQTPANHSFWELSIKDRRNFLLLVMLYFLQGVPMGLATGSVPFLLKSHLSYGQIGIFSLASYPYSLKLLWSPIVDAVWSPKLGRRKSWILPIQMLSGFGMLWLGARATKMMEVAGADGGAGVWGFTGWWFFLVFMCATQDIAVDGELSSAYGSRPVGTFAYHRQDGR